MSSLAEIEEAIDRLPAGQAEKLAAWFERRRAGQSKPSTAPREPDFSHRARKIWGDKPAGKLLSELVTDSRG